jgi:peptidyl-prolyl cis-trans isomerase SurA
MDIRYSFTSIRGVQIRGAACVTGLLCVCLLLKGPCVLGSEIDRLLVAVNGKVITEGDLSLARSLNEVILNDQSVQTKSRESEIDRLIDLELMRQELQSFSMTQEDESGVEARLQSLRDAYASKGGLPFFLNKLGLRESELIAYLRLQSSIMKFVNFRFRPFVKVSKEEIKAYYDGRLADQLQKANLSLPPLAQVSGRIVEVLKEEKVNAALEQWIKEIRRNSRIEYFNESADFQISGMGNLNK